MHTALAALTVAAVLSAQQETPRKPNPFAPSLPLLTDEEEAKIDAVIDKFIAYDSGKLKGPEGRKAQADFIKLGPEAIPALIRGLNKAAKIEHSCPAVTIAKKLARMLRSSHDMELLQYARENIGAGVEQSRHMGVIKDLRMTCIVQMRAAGNAQENQIRSTPTIKGNSVGPKDPSPGKP